MNKLNNNKGCAAAIAVFSIFVAVLAPNCIMSKKDIAQAKQQLHSSLNKEKTVDTIETYKGNQGNF